jgi:cation diffusion facilitator CzcD-associated flavoprotein CzcO
MPAQSTYRVVVVGAGFGGIGMAAALQQAGLDDFLVVDRAADLGGTWRDNTYPGLSCDIPSNLYSYSGRPGRWSRRFPPGQEILGYLRERCAERGLSQHFRFGAGVAAAEFDERRARWQLTLEDGGTLQAHAVVSAVGQLGRPRLPDIPGRDSFGGPSWHSARWDHGVDLAGRRVAVLGTGASAIQFVPEIAKTAGHVDVFQRNAPYILPKSDRAYRPGELALYDRLPVLRAKCIPDYRLGCKRVLFSDDWYPTLNRPNVELVTDPIERIAPGGVVTAGGATRPADVLVYGTGFHSHDFLAPMAVTGRGGRQLQAEWRDGAEAYLGITVSGFPNFFMLYGPNTNLGGNSIIYMLEGQIQYVLGALRALESAGLDWLDVRPEVQRAFNEWVVGASRTSVWQSGCQSWYTDAAGRNTSNWPDQTYRYRRRVRHFDLACYQVMPKRAAG